MATQSRIGWRPYVMAQQLQTATYLLDSYSGAAAAYSLRKLNSTYTGSAIRVRRSGDNSEQNIGFDAGGNLDTTSLLSFVGVNNQALYSEEFDNAYWSKYIVSVTSNQTTAPDGTMTADLLAESSANNGHALLANLNVLTFAIGTSWNISVYVKKGPGTAAPDTFILGWNTINTPAHPAVLFNISSGTILNSLNPTNDANFGSSIVDAGNGWWRCSVWGTVTVAGNRYQVGSIRFNNNLNTINGANYAGNAQANMYIWGYQFLKALNDTSVLTTIPYTKTTAVSGGSGFVTTWYDQSVNNKNVLQATSVNQPQIVSNGSILLRNGKPAIDFTSGQTLRAESRVIGVNSTSIFNVFSVKSLTARAIPWDIGLNSPYTYYAFDVNTWQTSGQKFGFYTSGHALDTNLSTNLSQNLLSIISNNSQGSTINTNTNYHLNNKLGTLPANSAIYANFTSASRITFGSFNGENTVGFSGTHQEFIAYQSNKLTDRTSITDDMNEYYSIWDGSIVQSGLIMNLDASFKSSYLGTGSAWTDISYNSNNGTLYNSPVSGTSSITFNGSSNYFTNGTAISEAMNTIDIWVKMKSTANVPIIYYGSDQFQSTQWTWGMGVYVAHSFSEGPMGYPTGALYTESVTLNVWKNFTMVRNDNGSVKLYKNGVLVGTKAGAGTTSVRVSTDRLYIAKAGSSYGNFDMGSVKIYNRALSATEVLQNFNATKSRFGL